MSYDLRIFGKLDLSRYGINRYMPIATPRLDSPTYNLRDMFVRCMDWDYDQDTYYKCSEVIDKIEHGIEELKTKKPYYKQFNPSNGGGDLDGALRVLLSLRECIYETSEDEDIPIENLYLHG